ncbi:MAG: bifunctional folylpolyglutamate synthase/dihydrofolate synthase [Candidatus Saganbacteria bacterium]|nr:bifunctional folylpolyglutamate synthase/dihydrofolate synthase [Candidatus Saganbacteria bacterium]
MNYKDCINEIEALDKFGINLGLERTNFLLSRLDSPHKKFKSVIVSGTNGKGSVVAMISSVLSFSGYKVGMYTSPHLLQYTERIKINGKDASNEDFVSAYLKVKKFIPLCKKEAGQPTVFEVLTAMAFLIFSEKKIDIAVLEVGLGGRFDATNVVAPLVSVITTIGLDHTDALGETLAKVAYEKAGIIKKNIPVVSAPQKSSALRVILSQARENKSHVTIAKELPKDFYVPLFGRHQTINTAVAVAALENLSDNGFKFRKEQIRQGLRKTRWRGRFEIIKKKPLIILDCAHNPSGAVRLAEALRSFRAAGPITLILGVQKYKDIKGIVQALSPVANKIIITRSTHKKAAPPAEIAKYFKREKDLQISNSVPEAIDLALKEGCARSICIAGSIFTVADAIKSLSKPRI